MEIEIYADQRMSTTRAALASFYVSIQADTSMYLRYSYSELSLLLAGTCVVKWNFFFPTQHGRVINITISGGRDGVVGSEISCYTVSTSTYK